MGTADARHGGKLQPRFHLHRRRFHAALQRLRDRHRLQVRRHAARHRPLLNRTLERDGKLDTLAVVKFHNGDHIGTTFENGYSSTIKEDQPWFAEMAIGDWFWRPGISYDTGGAIVQCLLEAISRDGAMMVNIPNRPDGSLDSGATNMLQGVGQWMAVNSEGIYGNRAWVTPTDGNFRFTVGTNGCLYAYYLGIPAGGTQLTIPSLATTSNLLVGAIGSVSLLGSASALSWSQTSTGLVVTLPQQCPACRRARRLV